MKGNSMQRMNWRGAAAGASLAALAVLPGCGFSGSLTNDLNITGESPNSSVAGPTAGDITTAAVFNGTPDADFHMDRATFGTQLTVQPGPNSLAFTTVSGDEATAAGRGLALFIDPRLSNTSGVGPYFNQRNC